ncbi:MAG TPA: hypothetical protein VJ643_07790, partial [Nitrososphaera sp.]|nr:hypothetical protein [Nitrososphaera sp.]
ICTLVTGFSTVSAAVLCDVNHKARRNLSLIKAKHNAAVEMYSEQEYEFFLSDAERFDNPNFC